MDKTQIILFLVISTAVIMIFIGGIVYFVFQYRKRKLQSQQEKAELEERHVQDILTTKLESQAQTMQFIGREIHDNVGQKLTLASLYSKQLLGNAGLMEDKISSIGNIIDESLAELRQLSKTLTNPQLANADLVMLLNEEARRINASGICHIAVISKEKEIGLPAQQKNILFRLLQEFIQNSLKHSGCRKIGIELTWNTNLLSIHIADDGKGFDTSETSGGIGLNNMKRRAEEAGAVYHLESQPGKGTVLSLTLNLPS